MRTSVPGIAAVAVAGLFALSSVAIAASSGGSIPRPSAPRPTPTSPAQQQSEDDFGKAEYLIKAERYDEAIPLFQQSRADPKIKIDSSIGLGRSFLEAGFADEAIDTLQGVIDEYQLRDDARYKEMHYWQGRAYEAQGNKDLAIKRYSQVAQSEFTYRDVQQRIKVLRGK